MGHDAAQYASCVVSHGLYWLVIHIGGVYMKFVLVIVLALVLFAVVFILLGDVNWCVDNFALVRVPHCMLYENNLFGRYIHP